MIRAGTATNAGGVRRAQIQSFLERSAALLFSGRRWLISSMAAVALVTFIGYRQIAGKYFVADDFVYINLLYFDYHTFLANHDWGAWLASLLHWSFVDPSTGRYFVRPLVVWTLLGDYLAWGLNPFGYHLNNILEQLAASFAVLLLAWELSHRRAAAILAGLIFALLPVHAGAVAWVTARGDVLCGLFMALAFILYIQSRTTARTILALACFLLALASKEMAVLLPPLLLLYELLARRSSLRAVTVKQIPFWILLCGYALLRLALFRGLGGPPLVEGLGDWDPQVTGYTLYVLDPLLSDIVPDQARMVGVILLILLVLCRKRREVVLGLVWIPLTIIPALLNIVVVERYFYVPSIGLALAAAGIVANPVPVFPRFSRAAGAVLAILLVAGYGYTLSVRNQDWVRAGEVSQRILSQLQAQYPSLPRGSQLYFTGVPERVRRAGVFEVNDFSLAPAIQLMYGDSTLQAQNNDKFPFPIVDDDWSRIHFFEFGARKLRERTDLLQALKLRALCKDSRSTMLAWDMTAGTQGWEPWNDVGTFEVRNGVLFAEELGPNPIIGGPEVNVPALALDSVEVEMRVHASKPVNGALYWQTLSMRDFSPGVKRAFSVTLDDQFHVYSFDLLQGMQYHIGDDLVRLRLDPTNAPAQIEIRSIRVIGRCMNAEDQTCECPH